VPDFTGAEDAEEVAWAAIRAEVIRSDNFGLACLGAKREECAMFAFTVRQIEVFLSVCDNGSFRAAAAALNISEAGVSNHIRALERQLDRPLFGRRRGSRIALLDVGAAFREEALAFVDRGRELRTMVATHATPDAPLKVYVGGHLLEDFIRPALPRLGFEHPQINLEFVEPRSRDQVRQEMAARAIDVVLMTVHSADELPGSVLLSDVEGGIYGVERYAEILARDGLAALPFLLTTAGSHWSRQEQLTLTRLGIKAPIVALRTQFHDSKVHAALDGLGVTMSIGSIVRHFDRDRRLIRLRELPTWQRRLFIADTVDPRSAEIIHAFLADATMR
jgi:DNA-binding transcriptional LysR family regulator